MSSRLLVGSWRCGGVCIVVKFQICMVSVSTVLLNKTTEYHAMECLD